MSATDGRENVGAPVIMHYQPIIEIDTGRTSRVEAFCRTGDGIQGLAAADFIPSAENGGLIGAVTSKVVELVLADRAIFGRSTAFSLNLSPASLREPEFWAWFLRAIAHARIDPTTITLELHDDPETRTNATTRDSMERLHARGIRFSIDRFGLDLSQWSHEETVYASVSEIKVYGDLFANLGKSSNALIMQSVTDIATRLGLDVVAKNVETREQLTCARTAGCRYAQGYAIARPMPAVDLVRWLASRPVMPPADTANGASRATRRSAQDHAKA